MIIRTGERTFVNTHNVQSITIERGGPSNSKWCVCLWYTGAGCQTHEFETEDEAEEFAVNLVRVHNFGPDEDYDDDGCLHPDEYAKAARLVG